jgi:dTDP-4-dehydrorhamnose reductase
VFGSLEAAFWRPSEHDTEQQRSRGSSVRVLVAGGEGQLGLELAELLPERGHETVALARRELDITDAGAVDWAIREHAPGVVINAAAFTNVDLCETETETAYAVNALGPRNLARACERLGASLLHVSTNYVFDGAQERPYEPFDAARPISAYGRTKLAGEEHVMRLTNRWTVVRTAGVYGRGHNFVRTMLRVAAERDVLKVKDDEFVSPTNARDLAEGIIRIIESEGYGLYHLTNAGSCSWYEFTREIFRLANVSTELAPIPGSEYPLPAARPANGVLSALGSPELRPWPAALADYLEREAATPAARG